MRRMMAIITSSMKMAFQELAKNKLRTFLSLFGVTIGIFCIIGVLATVGSLEQNIQSEIKTLGTNTIYIDKWEYNGGPDYPWWKYVNRPSPRYVEIDQIKSRTPTAKYVAMEINTTADVEVGDNLLKQTRLYGVTEHFSNIQPLDIAQGRSLTESEYNAGANTVLLGNEVAEKLFGTTERALGKTITMRGKKGIVAGCAKKARRANDWRLAVRPKYYTTLHVCPHADG
jgi:putative ABC transport system permease protein